MELINLTGHKIILCGKKFRILEPSGEILRITYTETQSNGIVDRWPKPNYLPKRRDGVIYVVSKRTAEAMAMLGRDDFVYPTRMKFLVVDRPVKVDGKQAFDEDGIPLYREEHIIVCAEQVARLRRKQ